MKIISYCIIALILVGITVTFSTENTVASSSATENLNNLNSGIFESLGKYKLKNKGKAKNKVQNKSKATATVNKAAEKSTAKVVSSGVQAAALAAPVPASGVNVLNDKKNASQGNTNVSLKAGPKLWEGWAKFYVYKTSDEKSLLKGIQKAKYYKNYEFYEQFKKNPTLNVDEVVDKEFKNIHDPYYFYVSLFPNNINFSNSRVVSYYILLYYLTTFYYRTLILQFTTLLL